MNGVSFVSMSGGEDWLLRPVVENMISYADLRRTELDLCDIAIMNEAIEVRAENSRRAQAAMENARGK